VVWEAGETGREARLRLFFSAFPGGLPGLSLLLLRAVIGIAIVVQAGSLIGAPGAAAISWLLGLPALTSGCMLLVGFLTPLAGTIVGIDLVAISISVPLASTAGVFDSRVAFIFGFAILLAIIGVGPGRFSVDARLFGRREIIIPLSGSSFDR